VPQIAIDASKFAGMSEEQARTFPRLQRPHFRGSILDANPPVQGVEIARRIIVSDGAPSELAGCHRDFRGRVSARQLPHIHG
jgi:hypothetical protein